MPIPPPTLCPPALCPGDQVAAITLSWAGASVFPHRYQAGKRQLGDTFNLRVVETPNALRDQSTLQKNPKLRVDDLHWALENPDIKGIFAIIGGDDSIRLLRHIDYDLIAKHPKVFMGYSDTTTTHFAFYKAGVRSFYGPSIMAGFGENAGIPPYLADAVRRSVFSKSPLGTITPNHEGWARHHSAWEIPGNQSIKRDFQFTGAPRYLQGTTPTQGHLIGGCLEVLEMIRGTDVWPAPDQWKNAILFIEGSEDAPPPEHYTYFLRSLAATGILDQLAGVIVGRPANIPLEKFDAVDNAIQNVIAHEEGRTDIPIVTRMDFGHTDPMFVLPYGVQAQIDPQRETFSILEAGVR